MYILTGIFWKYECQGYGETKPGTTSSSHVYSFSTQRMENLAVHAC